MKIDSFKMHVATLLTFTSISNLLEEITTVNVKTLSKLLAMTHYKSRSIYKSLLVSTEQDSQVCIRTINDECQVITHGWFNRPAINKDSLEIVEFDTLSNVVQLPNNQQLVDNLFMPTQDLLHKYIQNYTKIEVLV